jgi:hypothetical protein
MVPFAENLHVYLKGNPLFYYQYYYPFLYLL